MTTSTSTEHDLLEQLRTSIRERLEKGELDIPLLPQVANQVITMTGDPNADASKLSSLIQQDQALAGQILRIANSPAYLPRSPIVSLQQAISWLGLNMLAGIAFSVSVQSGVFNTKGFETEIKQLWRISLTTGLYGKEIARKLRHNVENAFLCGLLHGIGNPALIHATVTLSKQNGFSPPWPIMEVIMREYYIPVGLKLAEDWKLPEPVKEAIAYHHNDTFEQSTHPAKGAIITCLAQQMARFTLEPEELSEEDLRALPVIQSLNFYPEDMDALLECQDNIRSSVETMIL